MVKNTETTKIVTQPKLNEVATPSLKRWLKHFFFMPATKRYFNQQDQHAIAEAVKVAEQGHVGEIQVVIEAYIPAANAFYQDTHARAKQLFAEIGVWDTEFNSGVLLYINLCDKKVEILIDRGIKKATTQDVWNDICETMIQTIKQQEYRKAVVNGVGEIGKVLDEYYAGRIINIENELSNIPIIIG